MGWRALLEVPALLRRLPEVGQRLQRRQPDDAARRDPRRQPERSARRRPRQGRRDPRAHRPLLVQVRGRQGQPASVGRRDRPGLRPGQCQGRTATGSSRSTNRRSTPGSRRRAGTGTRWKWARWRATSSATRRAFPSSRSRWTWCSASSACRSRRCSRRSAAPRPADSSAAGPRTRSRASSRSSSPASRRATRHGQPAAHDPHTWPKACKGYGFVEAPRGALGHWIDIDNMAIKNYQCIVPTTWNASPRDAAGQHRRLRGSAAQHADGRPGEAARDPAYHPQLRSLPGLRDPRARHGRQRSQQRQGALRR